MRSLALVDRDTGEVLWGYEGIPLQAAMWLAHVCHGAIERLGFMGFWERTRFVWR